MKNNMNRKISNNVIPDGMSVVDILTIDYKTYKPGTEEQIGIGRLRTDILYEGASRHYFASYCFEDTGSVICAHGNNKENLIKNMEEKLKGYMEYGTCSFIIKRKKEKK